MKKTISLLLAVVMVFGMTACGKKSTEEEITYRNDVKVADIVEAVKNAYGKILFQICNIQRNKSQ